MKVVLDVYIDILVDLYIHKYIVYIRSTWRHHELNLAETKCS